MHQDVFTKVLSGKAEVDEGGAKGQGAGQLEEGEVVLMVTWLKTFMKEQNPDRKVPLLIAWRWEIKTESSSAGSQQLQVK